MVLGQKYCLQCEMNGENKKKEKNTFLVIHTSAHPRHWGRVFIEALFPATSSFGHVMLANLFYLPLNFTVGFIFFSIFDLAFVEHPHRRYFLLQGSIAFSKDATKDASKFSCSCFLFEPKTIVGCCI